MSWDPQKLTRQERENAISSEQTLRAVADSIYLRGCLHEGGPLPENSEARIAEGTKRLQKYFSGMSLSVGDMQAITRRLVEHLK